jgi:hypothetical protein
MNPRHQHPTPVGHDLPGPRQPDPDAALAGLREEFPLFRFWQETIGERMRYVAQRAHPGVRPHTVVTADPGELHAALTGQDP